MEACSGRWKVRHLRGVDREEDRWKAIASHRLRRGRRVPQWVVGCYVMDNAELTQRDRVLVMAAAGNKLTTEAIYPALRRMGPFLQGTVPIGRGLSDRPWLPELQPDFASSSATGNTATRGSLVARMVHMC